MAQTVSDDDFVNRTYLPFFRGHLRGVSQKFNQVRSEIESKNG